MVQLMCVLLGIIYQILRLRTYKREVTEKHYNGVKMDAIATKISSFASVYSAVYLGADQRKHQSSASLAFMSGIHRRPVSSRTKGQ